MAGRSAESQPSNTPKSHSDCSTAAGVNRQVSFVGANAGTDSKRLASESHGAGSLVNVFLRSAELGCKYLIVKLAELRAVTGPEVVVRAFRRSSR